MEGRLISVGDVHGCLKTLKALIYKIQPKSTDKFIFHGDYIDRGPDSKGVIDFLIDFRSEYDCVLLRGNHEQMLIDTITTKDFYARSIFIANGGDVTIKNFNGIAKLDKKYIDFFNSLELSHETDDYFFVHAGIDPSYPINDQSQYTLLWERNIFIMSQKNFGKKIVFGHTPFKTVLIQDNKIGIDTGCVYKGKLSAIDLNTMKIFEQELIDKV